jgi:hypothetical protein
MNVLREAAKRLEFLIELNEDMAADEQIDATSFDAVHDFLLGWPEYNYGGKYVKQHTDVANAIVKLAKESK